MKNSTIPYLFILCLGLMFSFSTVDAKPLEPALENMTKKELRQQNQINKYEGKLAKAKTQKAKTKFEAKIKKLKSKKQNNSARNTMAWIGLAFGILGFIMVFILGNPVVFFIGLLFALSGLVLSILGIKSDKKGAAITGLVLSTLAILVGLILLALFWSVLVSLGVVL